MANKFASMARQATSLSSVMEGRSKISMEDIMKAYPNGVTVTEFDFVTTADKRGAEHTYPVLAIAEDSNICFFGGAVLNKICVSWAESFDGDIQVASDALKAEGGVKMRFEKGSTKSGNSITKVIIE